MTKGRLTNDDLRSGSATCLSAAILLPPEAADDPTPEAMATFPASIRFLFTLGSPSAFSAADRFVPVGPCEADVPWYAASSAAGFTFFLPP